MESEKWDVSSIIYNVPYGVRKNIFDYATGCKNCNRIVSSYTEVFCTKCRTFPEKMQYITFDDRRRFLKFFNITLKEEIEDIENSNVGFHMKYTFEMPLEMVCSQNILEETEFTPNIERAHELMTFVYDLYNKAKVIHCFLNVRIYSLEMMAYATLAFYCKRK